MRAVGYTSIIFATLFGSAASLTATPNLLLRSNAPRSVMSSHSFFVSDSNLGSPPPLHRQRTQLSSTTSNYEKRSLNLGSAGRLNLFGAYYGSISIILGLVWSVFNFMTFLTYNFFWRVVRYKGFDRARRFTILCSHIWGVCLMRLTR